MKQREKIEQLAQDLRQGKGFYKKFPKVPLDDQVLDAVAKIERLITEGKIEELLRHGKFSLPDKPSDYENQRLINERLATLQASLKSKEV